MTALTPGFYVDLDEFVGAYLETMLKWGARDHEGATLADLSPAVVAESRADCKAFVEANTADLEALPASYCDEGASLSTTAGRDFWTNRNDYAWGFWSRRLGDVGWRLGKAAGVGNVKLVAGPNGLRLRPVWHQKFNTVRRAIWYFNHEGEAWHNTCGHIDRRLGEMSPEERGQFLPFFSMWCWSYDTRAYVHAAVLMDGTEWMRKRADTIIELECLLRALTGRDPYAGGFDSPTYFND